jgi:hypothetical protein
MNDELTTNITIADIKLLMSIIDVCSTRGAFRPNEFAPIGSLYEKLASTIKAAEQPSAE